jgi:hypothetical protein
LINFPEYKKFLMIDVVWDMNKGEKCQSNLYL